MVKVSIIVPVYNVERYIRKCIDSILTQTFHNFELLLINDGSNDESGVICEEYAVKDNRIKVFHKKNGGVSSARNLGIEKASGQWITFIDADDWIDKETLEKCLEASNDEELVRFGMKYVFEDNSYVVDVRLNDTWDYADFFSKVFSRQTALGVCGGLYLRSIFLTNKISFNSNYTLGEDWLVLVQYLKCVNKVRIINHPFYNYNKQNETSITTVTNLKKFFNLNKVASIICYDKDIINKFNNRQIASLKANVCAPCLANLLLKRSKIFVYLELMRDMVIRNIYPSFIEILNCELHLKFKLILLLFCPVHYYMKICK